ncbi:hypothetical protein GGS20DRAFT_573144 [Poronia punctata]|nr:hypothetical protein GGS20DRAFT_573144 [Poronia punctata]
MAFLYFVALERFAAAVGCSHNRGTASYSGSSIEIPNLPKSPVDRLFFLNPPPLCLPMIAPSQPGRRRWRPGWENTTCEFSLRRERGVVSFLKNSLPPLPITYFLSSR